jgi:serine/threonine-protein kinase
MVETQVVRDPVRPVSVPRPAAGVPSAMTPPPNPMAPQQVPQAVNAPDAMTHAPQPLNSLKAGAQQLAPQQVPQAMRAPEAMAPVTEPQVDPRPVSASSPAAPMAPAPSEAYPQPASPATPDGATRVQTLPVDVLMQGPATKVAPVAAMPPHLAPAPGLIIPGFELAHMVGEGGMSRVYRATQKSLRRQVCIKVMREEFAKDSSLAERFHDEGIALAALRHPNIVSVLDVGRTDDGQLYMVMEYVDGGDLRALLAKVERVSVRETVTLISQLLGGLAEAHASGIIHRDLKPSNVLLTTLKDGSTLLKLVDFGIAKLLQGLRLGPVATRQGTVVGTPGYMAPEQLLGLEVVAATDLYAVGVILFELLTGRRPFIARDEVELAQLTMMTPVPRLRQVVGDGVPLALDELIVSLLAKNPKERPQSAAEVRVRLNSVNLPAAA